MSDIRLLLVDDEGDALLSLGRILKTKCPEIRLQGASTAEKALILARGSDPHVAVIDLCLEPECGVESGYALLRTLIKDYSFCRIIVLTGHASVKYGVRALDLGASNFLEKPADPDHLVALIKEAANQSRLRRDYTELQDASDTKDLNNAMVGDSPQTQSIRESLRFAARNTQAILITGETGVGKGLCAELIHTLSPRAPERFVRYQPSFASADLVTSELFGHVKGSFTGALQVRKGLVAEASGGTLFLDEIDEIPLETQVSLLGLLQNKRYRPLGSDHEELADFRLICATNRPIEECLEKNKLRKDFYHRIAHGCIRLTPLRERREDIPDIARHVLRTISRKEPIQVFGLTQPAIAKLVSFDWPGNVRQLEAVVENAVYKAQWAHHANIEDEDVQLEAAQFSESQSGRNFHEQVQNFKIKLVQETLARNEDSQAKAATELGLDPSTLRRILGKKI